MTFSEYITKYAWRQYKEYCSRNGIQPVLDTDIKPQKICALCKPKHHINQDHDSK